MFLNVIIDGRDLVDSDSPDAATDPLVVAVARWAAEHQRSPVVAVVLAGTMWGDEPGMREHDQRTVVVTTGDTDVEDVIAGEVDELRDESEPVIVVTNEPALRERVEARGAKVVDGRSFLRTVMR